jgi:hypothetical protein
MEKESDASMAGALLFYVMCIVMGVVAAALRIEEVVTSLREKLRRRKNAGE